MMLTSASFVGCTQKDYGSEIESLQKQITDNKTAIGLLQQAMAKGQMITKVETVATGYKLTMSDGSLLNLTNGKEGVNGKDAPAAKLRVNTAKNWEVSTDNGTTWNEVKDADGNSIADAKTFVQNYVKINADGKLVLGDKETSFTYDVTIPSVTILQNELIAVITVPNADAVGGFDTARVPMEGYFDKWSVTGIKTVDSKTTLAVTKVTLQADATIDGVDYASGTTVYTSAGIPVVLNPSMIDASAIKFTMVASLEEGEAYELPMELKATVGTDQKISTITKAAPTAVWTINLASASAYHLKGTASNVALCATNQNGTHTLSDYLFSITEAAGSSAAITSSVVDAEGFQGADAVVAPATNIAASTLFTTDPADASKVMIFREDASVVNGETGKYEHYTGAYHVVLLASPAARDLDPTPAPTQPVAINLTYECLGLDGAKATATVKTKFIQNSPVARQYVVEDPFTPSGDNTSEVLNISQADLLTALFGDNSIAKAEFVAKGINLGIEADEKAAASGVTVIYTKSGSEVTKPANANAFDNVSITVPQTALFAREYVPVEDIYKFTCTFQLGGNTPPTYTLGFDVLFALDGTSSVLAADWTGSAPQIAADGTDVAINLTDVTLYTDEGKTVAITTTGAVLEFIGIEANDKVSLLFDADADTYKLVRTGEAPLSDETVSITLLGTDVWGQEFSVMVDVTLKA